MIVNCRRLRNILSFFPYLSVNCICASLPKIVDRIRHEKGEAPRAGLPKIIYTTEIAAKVLPQKLSLQKTTLASFSGIFLIRYPHFRANLIAVSPPSTPKCYNFKHFESFIITLIIT